MALFMLANIDFADARSPLFPDGLAAFLFGGSPRIKKRQDSAPSNYSISNEPTLPTRRSQMGSIQGRMLVGAIHELPLLAQSHSYSIHVPKVVLRIETHLW